ncbi:ATP-dependent RNA helicase DDX52 isoform X2-like [Oopsacas minuta]|uniref:Probable ATP-dependent RNA helicase DDX52 n=1 Tax=Oopsacas minuta TaxID=111878 RepID=A0AAV7JDN7_9METZ|nr:ATP-dependent RNA helicase DDX52 isoform X2-like [Oopsacas minuta]
MVDTNNLFKRLRVGTSFNSKSNKDVLNQFIANTHVQTSDIDPKRALDFFEDMSQTEKQSDSSKRKRKKHKLSESVEISESIGNVLDSAETEDTIQLLSDNTLSRSKKIKLTQKSDPLPDQSALLRKQYKIHVKGSDIPAPHDTFQSLHDNYTSQMPCCLLDNLIQSGFMSPTPIQMQAIPLMMHNRDVLCCAPTGSGKTAAFVLPILSSLHQPQRVGFRALVLTPTRELAAQIYREFIRLSIGVKFQIHLLTKSSSAAQIYSPAGALRLDILVATPKRLLSLLSTDPPGVSLKSVRWLVLDEADKLFEAQSKQPFVEQISAILTACSHPDIRLGLFSATLPDKVDEWCRAHLPNYVRVTVGVRNSACSLVEQELKFVGSEDGKLLAIRQMVQEGDLHPPVLIFLETVERAKDLMRELIYDGINADVIHSERTQAQRDNVVKAFRAGKLWVLIATELVARGMDFKGVNMVINFDMPCSLISYIHRVGRTGRAGRPGRAITLFTEGDINNLRSIATAIHQSGHSVEPWMLELKKPGKREKRARKARKRKPIRVVTKLSYKTRRKHIQRFQKTKRKT